MEATLMDYGVNTSHVSLTLQSVAGDLNTQIEWRVDVEYVGNWMQTGQAFLASLHTKIHAMTMSEHANSVWTQVSPLTVVKVIGIF